MFSVAGPDRSRTTRSVISSSRNAGSIPVSCSVRWTLSKKSGLARSRDARLTDRRSGSSPWSRQARSWRQACQSTQLSRETIRSLRSAMGMKWGGSRMPRVGWSQRIRASTPTIWAVRRSM